MRKRDGSFQKLEPSDTATSGDSMEARRDGRGWFLEAGCAHAFETGGAAASLGGKRLGEMTEIKSYDGSRGIYSSFFAFLDCFRNLRTKARDSYPTAAESKRFRHRLVSD